LDFVSFALVVSPREGPRNAPKCGYNVRLFSRLPAVEWRHDLWEFESTLTDLPPIGKEPTALLHVQ